MKIDKAFERYMLSINPVDIDTKRYFDYKNNPEVGLPKCLPEHATWLEGKKVDFTAGYKQGRIKALDEFMRITTLPMEGEGVWVNLKAIHKLDTELKKLRSE